MLSQSSQMSRSTRSERGWIGLIELGKQCTPRLQEKEVATLIHLFDWRMSGPSMCVTPVCIDSQHLSIDITEGYGSSFLVKNKSRTNPRNEEDWRRYPITPITTLEPSFLAGGRCPLPAPLCMLLEASHDCLTWRCHLACLSALRYSIIPLYHLHSSDFKS